MSKKLTYQNIYKHKIKGIQFSNKKVKVSNRKKKAISINFLKSKFTRRQKYQKSKYRPRGDVNNSRIYYKKRKNYNRQVYMNPNQIRLKEYLRINLYPTIFTEISLNVKNKKRSAQKKIKSYNNNWQRLKIFSSNRKNQIAPKQKKISFHILNCCSINKISLKNMRNYYQKKHTLYYKKKIFQRKHLIF